MIFLYSAKSFDRIFQQLGIMMTTTLERFLNQKEYRKEYKKKYDERVDMKVRRSKEQQKNRQQVLKERSDNAYGTGIGLNAGIRKKQSSQTSDTTTTKKMTKRNERVAPTTCKCGSNSHLRTTHSDCPLNKKRKISSDATAVNDLMIKLT